MSVSSDTEYEQPEPLTSQQAGAVIIKSFQADDDIIKALFRVYIYILKLATVKYRLAPKVCAAQGISTNGNPHATCLKVTNQTNKLLNKICSKLKQLKYKPIKREYFEDDYNEYCYLKDNKKYIKLFIHNIKCDINDMKYQKERLNSHKK